MPRDYRYRAEFAHRPRVAEQHAVQHAPFDIRQGDAEEGLQARRAQRDRSLLLLRALFLHQRYQRTRDERKRPEITGRTENGRSISEIRKVLPRKSNLAIAQAATRPNARLRPTEIAATISVSLIADSASGSDSAVK